MVDLMPSALSLFFFQDWQNVFVWASYQIKTRREGSQWNFHAGRLYRVQQFHFRSSNPVRQNRNTHIGHIRLQVQRYQHTNVLHQSSAGKRGGTTVLLHEGVLEREWLEAVQLSHSTTLHPKLGNNDGFDRLGLRKADSVRKYTRTLACHFYKWSHEALELEFGIESETGNGCDIFDHYNWYRIYCFLKVFPLLQISCSCRSGVFLLKTVTHWFSSVVFLPPHFRLFILFVWFQPMTHVCAKHLATFVSQEASNRPVLLGLALKDSSIDAIKQMQELVRSCKVW